MSFNRSVYSFLSACLLVGSIATLPAQTPRFPMEYYTVEDGLPDNDCYHMIQDHLGYIWIGTKLGLSRFDGYEFKNYELPLLDSVGSLTQAIVFIKEDKAGNLWFGANKGLYHFDRALNKFHFLPLADSLIDENSLVHYIFEDKKGRIWTVSGPENHLHRWDPQSQVFVAMYLASAGKERVKVGKPNALADHAPIVEDEKGQIWVGTMGAGLAFYDPQKDELTPVHPTKEAWPSDTLYSLLCDRQQTLWVGTAKGLAHYDAEGKILLPFSGGDPGQGQPVWGLQQDRQGGIWLQHTFSLMRLKPENGFGKEYFRLPEIGFDQGIVLGRMKYFVWIGEDLAGNLYWANPLNHHQFFQYDLQADSVKTFVHEFAGKPRNWGRNYDALYQTGLLDRSGLIWLGYNAGLLKARNRDAHFFTKKSDIQEDVPLFAEDPSGNVWVAANQSWLFNPENQRLIDFEAVVPGLMPIDNLPTGLLHFDRRSNLWLEKQGNFIQITFPDNQQTFVNLALGKKAKASSIQNTPLHLPEYAVDGDLKTRWSSEWSDPQWLELDLGKREYVDHFILYWEACFASQYEIQLSDDGQTWRTAFTNTNGEGGEESISLRQWTRFLRIRGTQRSTQWCYSIWEWEVYGNSPQKENIVLLSDMRGQFVTSFLEDRQGMIWLGTSGIGLVRYDHRSGQYTHYPFLEWQEQISPDILNIPKIYEDRNGLFWLSQANDIFSRAYEYPEGRIFLFDKQSEKLSQFLPPLENAAEVRYKKLWGEDRQGFVWISGTTGIYRYRSSTNEINHYLPRASVTSFLEDDQGRFWVGSANKGLYALDPKKESVRNYRMQDGLVFDGVRTLRQDGKGHIWIGTEKGGLSCFYPEEERFENYNEADGLFGDKIQSSFKDSQGRLYFGGPGGFSFFDPANSNPIPPRLSW
jgi:ligand-binding sensor domain-containing protein